ncbi:MAG: 50S ribosomal protein L5, partial [Candidatus Viridilinea halotolerans]
PRLKKIVVNVGVGEAVQNSKALEATVGDITTITGQKPMVTKARKSVASFKLREGMPIGVMVTMRGDRMYDFYDRLVNLALPRIRDFRGLSRRSFDGRGNYSLGLREQIVFPDIDYDKIDKLRGLEVVIVTTAPDDEQAYALLKRLGMPFRD